MDGPAARALARRSRRHDERQEMLLARMILRGIWRDLAIINQIARAAFRDRCRQPIRELADPSRRRRVGWSANLTEIVGCAAAGEDQNPGVANRRDGCAQRKMMRCAAMRLERHLDYRDSRLRVHQQQRTPRAMVEAAPL